MTRLNGASQQPSIFDRPRSLEHLMHYDIESMMQYGSIHYELEDLMTVALEHHDYHDLMHYASKYYDPVKAHEYYMRTRELKGGRSTRDLSDDGKEVWKVTKANITEEKKAQLEKAKEEHTIKMEAHRELAKQKREAISARLKEVLARISDQKSFELKSESKRTSDKLEKESEKTQKELDAESKKLEAELEAETAKKEAELEAEVAERDRKKGLVDTEIERLRAEDYSNLPPALKAKRVAERKEKISQLTGDKKAITVESKKTSDLIKEASSEATDKIRSASKEASTEIRKEAKDEKASIREASASKKEGIRDTVSKAQEGERDTAKNEREALSAEVKQTLDAAREAYAKVKEAIAAGAEANYAKEFDAIKAEYGKDSGASGGSSYEPPNRSAAERKAIREALAKKRKK